MSDFQVVVSQKEGVIEFSNFETIKNQLASKMGEFKDAVFTEETKPIAKAEVASLRKLRTDVDERRKDVKNVFMKPYLEFESKTKELLSLIDEPIALIDKQVKAFDEKQKSDKRQTIKTFFNEVIGDMEEYIQLDKIYDSKWENVSTTMKSVKDSIVSAIDSTSAAVMTIKGMNSEAASDALEKYKRTLSLTDAITYINNYEMQKQKIIENRKREEAEKIEQDKQNEIERIRMEERQKLLFEQQQQKEIEQKIQEAKEEALDAFIPDQTNVTSLFEYRIELSKESKETLEMYMDSVGIEWEVI